MITIIEEICMYGLLEPKTDRERILKYVTDPAKREVLARADEEVVAAIASAYFTREQADVLNSDPILFAMRVIFYKGLMDWGSEKAEQMYAQFSEFVEDPTFVQFPECFTDPTITQMTRREMMEDHSQRLETLSEFELEIIGARIRDGLVEVLVSHSQVVGANDGISRYIVASQRDCLVPPVLTHGILKRNPAAAFRGMGGELYIGMKAPYSSGYIEVVIPEAATA